MKKASGKQEAKKFAGHPERSRQNQERRTKNEELLS